MRLLLLVLLLVPTLVQAQTPTDQDLKEAVDLCKLHIDKALTHQQGQVIFEAGFEDCTHVMEEAAKRELAKKEEDARHKEQIKNLKKRLPQ